MRTFLILSLLALSGCTETAQDELHKQHMTVVQYTYETGCLQAFLRACGYIKDDELRGQCMDDGLKSCNPAAVRYRKWLEGGKT